MVKRVQIALKQLSSEERKREWELKLLGPEKGIVGL